MSTTYRITLLGQAIDSSVSPSPLMLAVFPQWNGEPTVSSESGITVTFASPQTPVDLGPLVKVEVVA